MGAVVEDAMSRSTSQKEGLKRGLRGVNNEKSKERIIEVPAGGDTWYVQMSGFETPLDVGRNESKSRRQVIEMGQGRW
jgi:hypothetical protein